MADLLPALLLVLAGYLVGAVPTGVLVARSAGAADPRTVGSGSTGSTNTRRTMGGRWALLVAFIDMAKGVVPILVARAIDAGVEIQALAGLAAVVGAWRSVWIGFAGGRGVATYFGGLLVIAPVLVLLAVPVFGIAISRTRHVSVGSLLGTTLVAVAAIVATAAGLLAGGWLLYVLPGAAVVVVAHRDNISRLLARTERDFDTVGEEQGPGNSAST